MYALIFNLQKNVLNKPKDLLVLQMFCQFPKDFVKLNQQMFIFSVPGIQKSEHIKFHYYIPIQHWSWLEMAQKSVSKMRLFFEKMKIVFSVIPTQILCLIGNWFLCYNHNLFFVVSYNLIVIVLKFLCGFMKSYIIPHKIVRNHTDLTKISRV
jgi:hypothetical protein